MDFKSQVDNTQKKDLPFSIEGEEVVKEEPIVREETANVQKEAEVPYGYIKIKLSSKGKFNCPETIHVRNYNSSDILEMSSQQDENQIEASIKLLDKIILEDIEVSLLTDKEIIEIYLNVYANWWGEVLQDYEYPLTKEDLEFIQESNNEVLIKTALSEKPFTVDIPIEDIKIDPIPAEFKEPIVITHDKSSSTISLRVPRISDGIIAKNYVKDLLKEEQRAVDPIEKKITREHQIGVKNYSITEVDRNKYSDFINKKAIMLVEVLQACMILGYNGKTDLSLEERIAIVKKLDSSFWVKYNKFLQKYTYGVQSEVKLKKSPVLGKSVIRRFQFRALDFILASDSRDLDDYDISFG